MNELLGWYGYDKVELRDSDNLDIGEMPQHISVLRGMKPDQSIKFIKTGQNSVLYGVVIAFPIDKGV